ncbi:MAG: type I 3-dehydroquinate dehydratase [Lachnospiraceae bacterium]|nr:type I 3-dehydroquinate dehydratase [Lachnospiraceae bacterium]
MNKTIIKVRGIALGDGIPKICVPLTARSLDEMEDQLVKICAAPCDLVELRADYFEGDPIEELAALRRRMPDMPVLFTFRTKEEGGERSISPEEYANLNLRAAADLIDLEVNRGEEFVQNLCARLQQGGAKVIVSFHDFERTPGEETLIHLLCRMQSLGADITKAALMPRTERDVLALLSAAVAMKEKYADRPYIVMSMGRLGMVSRLAGHLTGSAVTFASAGAVSAPGQMDAALVFRVLSSLSNHDENTR